MGKIFIYALKYGTDAMTHIFTSSLFSTFVLKTFHTEVHGNPTIGLAADITLHADNGQTDRQTDVVTTTATFVLREVS
jgi:hypothetical protein